MENELDWYHLKDSEAKVLLIHHLVDLKWKTPCCSFEGFTFHNFWNLIRWVKGSDSTDSLSYFEIDIPPLFYLIFGKFLIMRVLLYPHCSDLSHLFLSRQFWFMGFINYLFVFTTLEPPASRLLSYSDRQFDSSFLSVNSDRCKMWTLNLFTPVIIVNILWIRCDRNSTE